MQAQAWLNRFAVLLYCGIALSFSACEASVTRRVLATVLSVEGTAEVRQKGHSEFDRITPATLLQVGSLVRIGTSGTLNLAFLPNTVASLSEKSELQIDDLAVTKDGNAMRNDVRSRMVRLLLLGGTMQVSFNRLPDSESDLAIKTPQGALSANSDCIFLINVGEGKTRVTCVYGMLALHIERADFLIEAGYFQEFPSSDLSPKAAAEDAQAQRDVMSMIETEHQLQELARHQRLLKPDFLDR